MLIRLVSKWKHREDGEKVRVKEWVGMLRSKQWYGFGLIKTMANSWTVVANCCIGGLQEIDNARKGKIN